MNIELHIEELILHGFPAGDRQQIAEAVQSELTRLLSVNDLPPALETAMDTPRLHGGSFAVGTGEKPESIGARIGQAVYEGMAVFNPSLRQHLHKAIHGQEFLDI